MDGAVGRMASALLRGARPGGFVLSLKPVLSSYGCYSCRYRVRGRVFRGRGAEGSEALEVSVAVEATAV